MTLDRRAAALPRADFPSPASTRAEINKLMISYSIPILDEANIPITSDTLFGRP